MKMACLHFPIAKTMNAMLGGGGEEHYKNKVKHLLALSASFSDAPSQAHFGTATHPMGSVSLIAKERKGFLQEKRPEPRLGGGRYADPPQ